MQTQTQPAARTQPPLSETQQRKLIELWQNLHGGNEFEARRELNDLFNKEFQTAMPAATGEQGAIITRRLLAELRAKSAPEPAAPAPAPAKENEPKEQAAAEQAKVEPSPSPAPVPATSVTFDEAPFSANVRALDTAGFDWQFTARAVTLAGFAARIEAMGDYLKDHGYTPGRKSQPASTAESQEEVPLCAVHNKPMTKRNKDGRSWWSCSERLSDGQFCQYRPKAK